MYLISTISPALKRQDTPLIRQTRRHMVTALTLIVMALLSYAAHADTKVTFDLKNGDKISDKTKIVAHINSSTDIDKADFYVDGMLRYTANSVPYVYEWDTIPDTEGAHTVKVTATDVNGKTASATLSVIIDNELGQGADALAQRARDALNANDLDTALRYARRSLKATPDNLNGARSLSEIYARQGDYVQAADVLSKAKDIDANSDALLELASYRLHIALMPEHAENFLTEIQAVSALRHKAADLGVELARKRNTSDTPSSHEAIGDALLNAGRVEEAIAEYSKSAIGDNAPLTSLNRLALAYVMNHEPEEAIKLAKPLQITKKDDAVLHAVVGLAFLYEHRQAEARAIVNPDLDAHVAASLVVASYADMLLTKHREARNEANEALSLVPNGGDVYYALSMASLDARESSEAAVKTLALSPFQTGPYLDYAGRIVLQQRNDRYSLSQSIIGFVLKMDPDNINAKIMRALIDLQTDHEAEAKTILEALYKDNPKAPDVLIAMSAYCNVKNIGSKTGDYMDMAREIDELHFTLQLPPMPMDCLNLLERKVHYRPDFYLTPGTLYPTSMAASQTP